MNTPRATRRAFVLSGVGVVAALVQARSSLADSVPPAAAGRYRSRPDLRPPLVRVEHQARDAANGYVLVAPFTGQANGTALILDDTGEPVWIHQSSRLIMNFRVQTWHDEPVLTWWEGELVDGFYEGECVIADRSYRTLKRFSAGHGFNPELHEFKLTSRNTALVSINNFVPTDLTAYDGPTDGVVIESVIQELDPATGRVLLEWHSLPHVGLDETALPASSYWDYFHLNSIDVDAADDNLVISARYPSTVYKLDRRSGEVLWRLGGKASDFQLGPNATFWFQHHARTHPGGLLSLFDDGADSPDAAPEPTSRAVLLSLDTKAMTADLVKAFPNPTGRSSNAMGSTQLLADGGVFVGWGTVAQITEFGPDGHVRFGAIFPGGQSCYRAFRQQWAGYAQGKPAIAVTHGPRGSLDIYASWNGATRITHWHILGGNKPGTVQLLKTGKRIGFETHLHLSTHPRPRHLTAAALDAHGRELGRSRVFTVS